MKTRPCSAPQLEQELAFYQWVLSEQLLPFWLERAVDERYGGFYTCFTNDGRTLVSEDKYTWSQGRMVWVLSELYAMRELLPDLAEPERYLSLAEAGARFLMNHCVLPEGHCTFVMDRRGKPLKVDGYDSFAISVYADCFVVIGLSRYAAVSGDERVKDFAGRLYAAIVEQVSAGHMRTEPYPIPSGFRSHGINMILFNTTQEWQNCLRTFGDAGAEALTMSLRRIADDTLQHFVRDDLIYELIAPEQPSLLTSYINPGHTLEDIWFMLHTALEQNWQDVTDQAVRIAKRTIVTGWDYQHGGLLLFTDEHGSCAVGEDGGFADHPMLRKVRDDWDMKLWWVHSEALYTALLCSLHTDDDCFADMYERIRAYTFRTFPNPDTAIGEWIQIRDRKGAPVDKVVALPVKDPFHAIRNVLLIIRLLHAQLKELADQSD